MPSGSPILALLGDKWIQVYGRDVDYLHFHNFLEIGYCYEGTGDMTLGEKTHRFSGGCFTVIPPNFPHTTVSDPDVRGRWEYLFIDVEGFLREMCQGGRRERAEQMQDRIYSQILLRRAEDAPEISGMIRQLLDIMRYEQEYYLEEAKGILAALLANLARKGQTSVTPVPGLEQDAELPVNLAMDYISRHYMETIKIDDLAAKCHISETHLRRLFSSYIKMSPLEYINMARIRMACEYLRTTNLPVTTIAQKCGFPILSTFNRAFKKITGASPTEWRKRPENYEQQILKYEIHPEKGW